MTSVPDATQNTRQDIARKYLALTREDVQRAESLRVHYARLARDYGLTNDAIGSELGMSAAEVLSMLEVAE